MPYIFDAILSETTEDHALDYARGMVWDEVEGRRTDWPMNRRRVVTINGIGVYYDYAADYYFFTDETGERSMYETINKTKFMETMRAIRPENFNREGLSALFDSLIEYEESVGDIEFDPIGICVQFTQYGDAIKACRDIGGDWSDMVDHLLENEEYETAEENARDALNDETWLVDCDDGSIVIDSEF